MGEEGESLCSRCASAGVTCCQYTQIFLSLGDVARIRAVLPGEDFWEYASPADDGYAEDFTYDPVWSRIFAPDGSRRVIRHRPDGGDCHFLTPKGCRLDGDVRPLVCRLYPFDYNAMAIKGVYGHVCPEPERYNAPLLLAMLGMNRDAAEGWRRLLYREIEEEFPPRA